MDMTDITGELVETGLPYNKFPVYAFKILFPADDVRTMTSHKVFTYPEVKKKINFRIIVTLQNELNCAFRKCVVHTDTVDR